MLITLNEFQVECEMCRSRQGNEEKTSKITKNIGTFAST